MDRKYNITKQYKEKRKVNPFIDIEGLTNNLVEQKEYENRVKIKWKEACRKRYNNENLK